MFETFHNQKVAGFCFVFPKLSSMFPADLPAESQAAERWEAVSSRLAAPSGNPSVCEDLAPTAAPGGEGALPAGPRTCPCGWAAVLAEARGSRRGLSGQARAAPHLGERAGGTRRGPAPPPRGGGAGRERQRQRPR